MPEVRRRRLPQDRCLAAFGRPDPRTQNPAREMGGVRAVLGHPSGYLL